MSNHATFIWSIADLLRGNFKAHQYGDLSSPSPSFDALTQS